MSIGKRGIQTDGLLRSGSHVTNAYFMFLAAFSCARAAGASGREAAAMANMAAEVTIRKIGTTGTAGLGEILARHGEILMGGR